MAQRNWANGGNSSSKYITAEMLSPFTPSAPGALPTTQVEMTLACRDLLNTDYLSKSDPFCVVHMKESWQDKYFEIGRTETIDDNLNPEWVKKFVMNYNFECMQKLKFEVWDLDPNGQDFLGRFETTLADIVSFTGRQFVGNLTGVPGKNCGQIVIVTEEVTSCKEIVTMQFEAEGLAKLSWICSNDPFLVISRANEDGSYSVVHKTVQDPWTQNPRWPPIVARVTTLCNGDYDRNLKIDCYDNRRNGNHKLIGTCFATLRSLCESSQSKHLNLIDPTKQRHNRNYNNSGVLKLMSINVVQEVTFLDYIRTGTQMHFAVAIDFTASNGAPNDPHSLHYLHPQRPNSYEIALRSIGEIIQHYDSSKLFPAFGFGAKVPPNYSVSHQFPLNGNPSHPHCAGVDDILMHYRNRLQSVQLFGPTNFSPVINNTISIASQFQDGQHYFVLLIITDGIISDMHQTKNTIINASQFPISIIIVGVGDADFEAMDELDSDDVRLSCDGRYAERDIVQFVPLNKFLTKSGAVIKSQVDLAREVLAEVPDQLTGFMKSCGFKPNLPKAIHEDTSIVAPTAPMT